MLGLPKEPNWIMHQGNEKYAVIPLDQYFKVVEYISQRMVQNKLICLGDLILMGETHYREGHKRFELLGITVAREVDMDGNYQGKAFSIDPMDLVNKDE